MEEKQSSKRRQRKSSEMYPLVEAYMKSDLRREDFCASHEISVSALGYWQTKYRKANGLSLGEPSGGFVSLELPSVQSTGSVVLELDLGQERVFRFYGYPELKYLKGLLSLC